MGNGHPRRRASTCGSVPSATTGTPMDTGSWCGSCSSSLPCGQTDQRVCSRPSRQLFINERFATVRPDKTAISLVAGRFIRKGSSLPFVEGLCVVSVCVCTQCITKNGTGKGGFL